MLEAACHELDFKLATCDVSTSGNPSTSRFQKLSLLKVELEAQKNLASVLSEMLTFSTLTNEDPYDNPVYESLKADVDRAQKMICDKVHIYIQTPNLKKITMNFAIQTTEITELERTLKGDFDFSKGVLYSTLDKSLQMLRIKRQAYQGGTFVGNHVHKLLQVRTIIC